MKYPVSPYIEERDGGLYVAESGVSLDSVAIRFQQGASPEKIVHSFPALKCLGSMVQSRTTWRMRQSCRATSLKANMNSTSQRFR